MYQSVSRSNGSRFLNYHEIHSKQFFFRFLHIPYVEEVISLHFLHPSNFPVQSFSSKPIVVLSNIITSDMQWTSATSRSGWLSIYKLRQNRKVHKGKWL